MSQEDQIQFVLDVTARAAREVIEHLKDRRICGPITRRKLRDWVIAACMDHGIEAGDKED